MLRLSCLILVFAGAISVNTTHALSEVSPPSSDRVELPGTISGPEAGDAERTAEGASGDVDRSSATRPTGNDADEPDDESDVLLRYVGPVVTPHPSRERVSVNGTDWVPLSRERGNLWQVESDVERRRFARWNGDVVTFTLPVLPWIVADSVAPESDLPRDESAIPPDFVSTTNLPTTSSPDGWFIPGESHEVDVIDLSRALMPSSEGLAVSLGEDKAHRIRILWAKTMKSTLEDSTRTAAFQLAIWMIVHENLQFSDDFHAGTAEQVKKLAEDWIAALEETDDAVQPAELLVFLKPGFPDQIAEVRPYQPGDLWAKTVDASDRNVDEYDPWGDDFGGINGTADIDQQILRNLFQQVGSSGSGSGGFGSTFPGSSGGGGFMPPGGSTNPGRNPGGGGGGGGGGSPFFPGNGGNPDPFPWPPIDWPPDPDGFPDINIPTPDVPGDLPTDGPLPGPTPIPEPSTAAIWLLLGLAMSRRWFLPMVWSQSPPTTHQPRRGE